MIYRRSQASAFSVQLGQPTPMQPRLLRTVRLDLRGFDRILQSFKSAQTDRHRDRLLT